MMKFVKVFLVFVVLYHLFVTIIGYGVLGGIYPQLPALGRDAIWLLFFGIVTMTNFKTITTYLRTRKRPRITFITLLIFGTAISLYKGQSFYDIFVGIKYGLLYLFIFLSATFIGYIQNKKKSNYSPLIKGDAEGRGIGFNIQHFIKYLLITTLIAGFLRQGLKFLRPDFFLTIGYGPLNDFKFGVKPPIYYLTGYQGTARRQGIFSGPNNYGYFLIAFLPVIILLFKHKIRRRDFPKKSNVVFIQRSRIGIVLKFLCGKFQSIKSFFTANKKILLNTAIIILRIVAILLTLSRTAFIGGIVSLALVNIQRIRNHKKLSRGIFAILMAGIVGVSILKGASTINHITAKFGSIKYIVQQPGGYGLGTSGPAVLHNGTILPENYYLQLMLDIGTLGFLLRALIIIQITRIVKKIQQSYKDLSTDDKKIYLLRQGLNIGRASLLIMGIFLHIFEDSMVNYLFFVTRGLINGYLSTKIDKSFAIKG